MIFAHPICKIALWSFSSTCKPMEIPVNKKKGISLGDCAYYCGLLYKNLLFVIVGIQLKYLWTALAVFWPKHIR
jgi:hypothetical protein